MYDQVLEMKVLTQPCRPCRCAERAPVMIQGTKMCKLTANMHACAATNKPFIPPAHRLRGPAQPHLTRPEMSARFPRDHRGACVQAAPRGAAKAVLATAAARPLGTLLQVHPTNQSRSLPRFRACLARIAVRKVWPAAPEVSGRVSAW
jgi:hypothetical protein